MRRNLWGRSAVCGVIGSRGRQLVWWVGESGRRSMLVEGMFSVGCDRSGGVEIGASGCVAKGVIVCGSGAGCAHCVLVIRVDGDVIGGHAITCRG